MSGRWGGNDIVSRCAVLFDLGKWEGIFLSQNLGVSYIWGQFPNVWCCCRILLSKCRGKKIDLFTLGDCEYNFLARGWFLWQRPLGVYVVYRAADYVWKLNPLGLPGSIHSSSECGVFESFLELHGIYISSWGWFLTWMSSCWGACLAPRIVLVCSGWEEWYFCEWMRCGFGLMFDGLVHGPKFF